MRRILLAFPLALFFFFARAADAGQVLKFSEEGTRKGEPYRSAVTLSAAAEGIRVEAVEIEESGPPKTYVFLYSARDDKVYPIDPPTGPVISAATWAVRRAGRTTRIVYLGEPAAVGVDASTRANLKRMGALFVPFVNAMHLAEGDLDEGFNTHALDKGFPVRELKSKDGVVEMDSHLVSVGNADLSPDLFRVPEPPAPAEPRNAAPATTPAPDRSITLEGWALRGMPDAGRPWTGADYDAAAGLLETIAREGAARLPRENSAASESLFRRFADPGNLASVRGAGTADERALAGAGVLCRRQTGGSCPHD